MFSGTLPVCFDGVPRLCFHSSSESLSLGISQFLFLQCPSLRLFSEHQPCSFPTFNCQWAARTCLPNVDLEPSYKLLKAKENAGIKKDPEPSLKSELYLGFSSQRAVAIYLAQFSHLSKESKLTCLPWSAQLSLPSVKISAAAITENTLLFDK